MKHPPLLRSNVKKRPWPLPQGFRYVQPLGGTELLVLNPRTHRLDRRKGKFTYLLAVNYNYRYCYVTQDSIVPVEFNQSNPVKGTPKWEEAINLAKPI